jgi:magnesium transporter
VLRLSDYLNQDVLDAEGARIGSLRDLVVRLAEPYPHVTGLVVGGDSEPRLVAWARVTSFERSGATLDARAQEIGVGAEQADELLLSRDVVDCQIVDVEGKRIARVGDVELSREGDALRCIAVDTGLAPVIRRVGLRRLADHLSADPVAWENLHFAGGRGHLLQLRSPAARMHRLTPGELMHLVGRLSVSHGADVLEAVPSSAAAGALSAGRPDLAAQLLQQVERERAREILERMPADDAAAAMRAMEKGEASRLLESLAEERATPIRALLAHAENTAGGVMTPDVRTAGLSDPVDTIRDRLASDPPPLDGLLTVILVDESRRPQGVLPGVAVLAGKHEPVPVPPVRTDTPLEEVLELFATYDVLAVPVVDAGGVLVGAVAIDDILDELLREHLPGQKRYPVMSARRHAPA